MNKAQRRALRGRPEFSYCDVMLILAVFVFVFGVAVLL